MINGVMKSVFYRSELSPTGTDRRGGPQNGIQPHGSSFFGNRGRIDAVAHAADQTATFGHDGKPYRWKDILELRRAQLVASWGHFPRASTYEQGIKEGKGRSDGHGCHAAR